MQWLAGFEPGSSATVVSSLLLNTLLVVDKSYEVVEVDLGPI
jgi:hypothetical protein